MSTGRLRDIKKFPLKKFVKNELFEGKCGTPGGTRTPNIQNRNLTLYPLNYGRISLTLI